MIQIGGVYTTLCQREGILLQKYAIEMGGVSRYFFTCIGVRGRFDSPESVRGSVHRRCHLVSFVFCRFRLGSRLPGTRPEFLNFPKIDRGRSKWSFRARAREKKSCFKPECTTPAQAQSLAHLWEFGGGVDSARGVAAIVVCCRNSSCKSSCDAIAMVEELLHPFCCFECNSFFTIGCVKGCSKHVSSVVAAAKYCSLTPSRFHPFSKHPTSCRERPFARHFCSENAIFAIAFAKPFASASQFTRSA